MSESTKAIIITGMHRSGTSLLAEALHSCGLAVAEKLIAPDPAVNPRGFWEDEQIVQINEDIFSAIDSSWFDIKPLPSHWWQLDELNNLRTRAKDHLAASYDNKNPVLIKDPRLSRLLPFWLPLFTQINFDVHVITVTRHPSEVARSLAARDSLPETYGHLLWLRYTRELIALSKEQAMSTVDYNDVLQEPQQVVTDLLSRVELDQPDVPDLVDIADNNLRHHKVENSVAASEIERYAADVYQRLLGQDHLEEFDIQLPDLSDLGELLSELAQGLVDKAGQSVRIGELHSSAQNTVAIRDQQLQETQKALEETGDLYKKSVTAISEKDQSLSELADEAEKARQVITEREQQLAATQSELEKTSNLYQTAVSTIEDKDASLAELVAEVEQARQVIAERDSKISELNQQLSELFQRLRASFLGRLALRFTDRNESD